MCRVRLILYIRVDLLHQLWKWSKMSYDKCLKKHINKHDQFCVLRHFRQTCDFCCKELEGFILTVSGLLPLITFAKLSKHKELFVATLVKVFIQIKLGPKWLSLL